MKKFFLSFLLTILFNTPLYAEVRSLADKPLSKPINQSQNDKDLNNLYKEIPNLRDKAAVQRYLKNRLKFVKRAEMTSEEIAEPSSTSIISTEEIKQKQQNTLSSYEKIYEESLRRAQSDTPLNANDKLDGTFYQLVTDDVQPFIPDFPYVTIKLAKDKEILAPAEEHIAYFLTTLEIETTGLISITEEITFVSNNEGFPQGFFRILPKYGYSKEGKKRRYDITLRSVTINDEEYPYQITEIGNYLYIKPKNPLTLPTGIYTYKFNYYIDRAIWYYENFDEFYWDITAKTLKNVVGSANALVILPEGKEVLDTSALISTPDNIYPDRVTIAEITPNSIGYADTEALSANDDMHILVTLEKGTLLLPDLNKKYFWFIQDHGSILFALLALIAIFLSYRISLKQIHRNQDKTKSAIRRTPAIFRFINTNVFDIRSLTAEMLDLISKNIITIKKSEDGCILIKKTDALKQYPKLTRKIINILFPGTETVLPSSIQAKLKLERAYKFLYHHIKRKMFFYTLRLNTLYICFSLSMLIFGIIGASFIAVNPYHTFCVIIGCSILEFPFLLLLLKHFSRRSLTILAKLFALIILFAIAKWLAIYTSEIYALLNLLSLWLIMFYYKQFSRRNGLLRNKIKETEEYKSYLQKNPELAVMAKDFKNRMPYIYAFELENKYKDIEIFTLMKDYEKLLKTSNQGYKK